MCCTSPKLRSASSYGPFTAATVFLSQCHIFRDWTLVDIERKLYKEICIGNLAGGTNGTHDAPFVALLIKGIQSALGEQMGAPNTTAPLET